MRRPTPVYLWIILKILFTRTFINLFNIHRWFFIWRWRASKEQLIWKLDELNTKHDIQKTNRSTELPSYRFRTSEIVKRQYSIHSNNKNQTNLCNITRLLSITAKSSSNDSLNRGITQSYWTSTLKQFRNLIGTNL